VSAGVGLALIPSQNDCQALHSLLAESEARGADFDFALNTSNSISHLSLMQATFDNENTPVELLESLNLQSLASQHIGRILSQPMAVSGISVWAKKIVFLNFVIVPELKQLHCDVANLWLPHALMASADPQSFEGISDGQKQSIGKTGYPFCYDEYLPHITLGHLKNTDHAEANLMLLNGLLKTDLPQAIFFDSLIAFAVEPLGLCRRIIREWKL
jgi:hypothetical protein